MATQENGSEHGRREEDVKFVGRLFYDVLVFTLRMCGLPEMRLPTTDLKENKYKSSEFLNIVGFNIVATSLFVRDKWKRIFISRLKSSGFNHEEVPNYVWQISFMNRQQAEQFHHVDMCQASLELYFASWNEIILFFHHTNINIDLGILMKLISVDLMHLMEEQGINGERIQKYYAGVFYNVHEHNKWISDFIAEHAIPYGFKNNLSEYFRNSFQMEMTRCFIDKQEIEEKAIRIDEQTIEKIVDRLGFLPHDIFLNIVNKECIVLPENFLFTSILPGNRKSPEPPIELESSKRCALKRKLRQKRSSRAAK